MMLITQVEITPENIELVLAQVRVALESHKGWTVCLNGRLHPLGKEDGPPGSEYARAEWSEEIVFKRSSFVVRPLAEE